MPVHPIDLQPLWPDRLRAGAEPMSQFPLRLENGKLVVETGPNRAIIRDVAPGERRHTRLSTSQKIQHGSTRGLLSHS